jgi:hypothetical protein
MSALLGGKDRLLRPVAFDDGIVDIGDFLSYVGINSANAVLVGASSSIGTDCPNSVLVGATSSVGNRSGNNVLVGASSSIPSDCNYNVVVGASSGIGNSAIYCTVVGVGSVAYDGFCTVAGAGAWGVWGSSIYGIQCTSSASYSFVGGSNSHVATNSNASVCIGDQNNVAPNSAGSISLGPSYGGFTIGELCPGGIVIGTGHIGTITPFNPGLVGSPNSMSIGTGSVVADGSASSIAMGENATVGSTSPASIVMGQGATLGNNSSNCFVAMSSTVSNDFSNVICLGPFNSVTDLAGGSFSAMTIGAGNLIAGTGGSLAYNVAVGFENTINMDSSGLYGTNTVVGRHVDLGSALASSFYDVVAMGHSMSLSGPANHVVLYGMGHYLPAQVDYVTALGFLHDVEAGGNHLVLLGEQLTVFSGGQYNVLVGNICSVGVNTAYNLVVGASLTINDSVTYSILIGTSSSMSLGIDRAIGIGAGTSVTGDYGVAIGASATAGANELVAGNSSATEALHVFTIKGYNGGVLDTIRADDNPAADTVGLSLVYNDGATIANRQVKASVAPPVGAVYLYL